MLRSNFKKFDLFWLLVKFWLFWLVSLIKTWFQGLYMLRRPLFRAEAFVFFLTNFWAQTEFVFFSFVFWCRRNSSKSLWVENHRVFDVKWLRNSWIWMGFSNLGGSTWRSFRAWEVQSGGPGVHIEVQECFWYQRPTMCGPNAGFACVFECIFGVLLESFFMLFFDISFCVFFCVEKTWIFEGVSRRREHHFWRSGADLESLGSIQNE